VLASAILSFYRAGVYPLGFDEAFVAWLSKLTGGNKVYAMAVDLLHPPLWYYLQGGWIALAGDSEMALRLFSAIFNVLTVALVAQFARLAATRRAGQWAAWLWAVLPVPIWYAHFARQHSLGVLLSLCSAWCLAQALRTRQSRWLVATGIVNAIGVYNLYMHLFVVFLEGLVLVLYLRRAPKLFWMGGVIQAIAVASLWPWLRVISGIDQTILHAGYIQPLSPIRLLEFLREFTLSEPLPFWWLLAWAPILAAPLWLFRRNPFVTDQNRGTWQLLVAVGLGMPAMYLVISIRRPVLELRYLYPMYWAAVVLWAAGLTAIRTRAWQYAAIGLLGLAVGGSLFHFYTRPELFGDDWRAAGAYLTTHVQPESALLFRGGQGYHPVVYYYHGTSVVYADLGPSDGVAQFPAAEQTGHAFKSLWVVLYLVEDHNGVPPQFFPTLSSPWQIKSEQAFKGVYLIEYVRTPGD
jgi:4-amino-4-deoxy-L-arabinose transferase-like glycosyltransferase